MYGIFSSRECFVKTDVFTAGAPMEFYSAMKMPPDKVAPPDVIVGNLMEERRRLIMGHYGDERNDKSKLDESLLP